MEMSGAAYLVDVVEVNKAKRVRCQAQGCGHSVYARIHVVLDMGRFVVLGGDCFQRLYGDSLGGTNSFYGGSASAPTKLSDEMRQLLDSNTAEFVEKLEQHRQEMEAEAAKHKALLEQQRQRSEAEALARKATTPLRPQENRLPGLMNSTSPTHTVETPIGAISDGYRYLWGAYWWTSSGQLFVDVRAALPASPHADTVYRALVGMVRQPRVTPVDFAVHLEREGVPRATALECLTTLQLAVREKLS